MLDNEKEREQISILLFFYAFLEDKIMLLLRKWIKKIAEYLPSYYGDTYRLEITENENEDMPGFVREYAERIRKSKWKQQG